MDTRGGYDSTSYQERHKVGHACGHQGVVHEMTMGGTESQAEALVRVLHRAEGFGIREGIGGASCVQGNSLRCGADAQCLLACAAQHGRMQEVALT